MPASPPAGLVLSFQVIDFVRNSIHFDLDNLTAPVFDSLLRPRGSRYRRAIAWWRASLARHPAPSLMLSLEGGLAPAFIAPPPAKRLLNLLVPRPLPENASTIDRGMPAAVQAQLGGFVPDDSHRFAVAIKLGPCIANITDTSNPPIKALVDCLYPMFGFSTASSGRRSIHDWKTFLLQVSRSALIPMRSAYMRAWLLNPSASASAHGDHPTDVP